VLNYSVVQRRREIGIRLAIGASSGVIARLVTWDIFSMVVAGAICGLALGMASVRYIETLFYQVKATDLDVLLWPALTVFGAAFLASAPAVIHAVRIDPVETLRSE
jgi:ABC-type antimicrobial peptide transport system permease subunit